MCGQVPRRVDGLSKASPVQGCSSLCVCGMLVLRGEQISLTRSGCGLSSHFSYEEALWYQDSPLQAAIFCERMFERR